MPTKPLPGEYKVGSTWTFGLTRKQPDGAPIDITGLTIRSMFREGAVNGPVKVTLNQTTGITVDAENGRVILTLPPEQTVLFTPGAKAFFDVEMASAGYAWQSPTYQFKTEAEVTR